MKARPILMSSPMIRALLDGRKTQTRRVVKPQPFKVDAGFAWLPPKPDATGCTFSPIPCPYGKPGDLLWVRESLRIFNTVHLETGEHGLAAYYSAGGGDMQTWEWNGRGDTTGIPSIHMPRAVSRLTLELTEVRVERLQDISEADATAEGVYPITEEPGRWLNGKVNFKYSNPLPAFIGLWCSINGQLAWKDNPWVWCLSFRIHQKNVDALLAELGTA